MTKNELSAFALAICKQRIASVCLALGWNSVGSTSMEVMQDLLVRYIRSVGVATKDYAELCNRTEPNLLDLQKVFDDFDITVPELEAYMDRIDDRALSSGPVPCFPVRSQTELNFLKPGSQEVLHRPMHVHDHFPAMYPELETQVTNDHHHRAEGASSVDKLAESSDVNRSSPEVSLTDKDVKELNPFREIDSVMMTASGFISPAREGRLPDARTPLATSNLATKSLEVAKKSMLEEGEIDDDDDDDDDDTTLPDRPKAEIVAKRKRAPKPRVKKAEVVQTHQDDAHLSDDDIYRPPAGFAAAAIVQQRKNKPKRSTAGSTPSYDENDEIQTQDVVSAAAAAVNKDSKTTTPPAVSGSGKKRGRKRKLENPEATANKSESSDLDICYDPPIKKKLNVSNSMDSLPSSGSPATKLSQDNSSSQAAITTTNSLTPKVTSGGSKVPPDVPTDRKPKETSKSKAITRKPKAIDKTTSKAASTKQTKATDSKPINLLLPQNPVAAPTVTNPLLPTANPLLPINPLIPKGLYGFEDLHGIDCNAAAMPTQEVAKRGPERPPGSTTTKSLEVKRSKSLKKNKKEKKDKEGKKRKKEKRPVSPPLFAPSTPSIVPPPLRVPTPTLPKQPASAAAAAATPTAASAPSPSPSSVVPKIKIKDLKVDDKPKIVIKNLVDPQQKSGAKDVAKKKEKVKKTKEHVKPQPPPLPSPPLLPSSSSCTVGSITTQTVGKYVDNEGREIWICPGCGKQDDGSPMIGCDRCDDWYHWICVNILQEPGDEDWFCPRCRARKSGSFLPSATTQSSIGGSSLSSSSKGSKVQGKRGRPAKHHQT